MTVAELITALQALPGDQQVLHDDTVKGMSPLEILTCADDGEGYPAFVYLVGKD